MLTELSVTNFKSWEQIDKMRLAPITGLFGSNSSGKTSVLQLLLMMKQTSESSDRLQVLNFGDSRTLISLGSFQDILHGQDKRAPLGWSLRWTLPRLLEVRNPNEPDGILLSGRDLCLSVEMGESEQQKLSVRSLKYRFQDSTFEMKRKSSEEEKYEISADAGTFKFQRRRGRAWDLPTPVKFYGFPHEVKAYYKNAGFLTDFEFACEQALKRLYYLGPLRDYPKREYPWSGAEPEDVGTRGELTVNAILAATKRGEMSTRGKGRKAMSFEENLAEWLKRLKLIDHFSVQSIGEGSGLYRVRVRKGPHSPMVLITDVGFGVSQILPVLVLCTYVPKGSTILLEQPEIHLHPSVQAGLADVLIDVAKHRKIQIIVESHSEHLLLRLQRRIAEGAKEENGVSDKDVALYFCKIDGKGSELEPLDVDSAGNIKNWPEDFFGDRFGEVAARQEAGLERKVSKEEK